MVSSIYKKTFSVLMKRPFRLWGISLLAEFLCLVAYAGFLCASAVGFHVDDLPQQLPHGT